MSDQLLALDKLFALNCDSEKYINQIVRANDKRGNSKKISRLWRMNYFFYLKENGTAEKFTQLCLKAGYYDQADVMKEFKSMIGSSPGKFFRENNWHINRSQENISRRFDNLYDLRH